MGRACIAYLGRYEKRPMVPAICPHPLIMKTLQHTLESILDTDFDITDQDLDSLGKFLREYK